MYKLIYLEVKDFFSFESFSIKFNSGLTLITGYDEGGKDSNGSGKSTVLNSISWSLFGRTLKGIQDQNVVRWGCKDCKVILILKGDKDTYEIERTLNTLTFKINNSKVSGHKLDIQRAIEDTFKTNYSLFVRSTAFSQGQVEFLAASGDAEKKRLFKEILSLSRLDKAYDKIKTQYDLLFSRTERIEGELGVIRKSKEHLSRRISEISTLKDGWEEEVQMKVGYLKGRKDHKPNEKEAIEKNIRNLENELEEYKGLQEDLVDIQSKEMILSVEDESYIQEVNRIWKLIEKGQAVGQRCEVCGSVVNRKMLKSHQRELEDRVNELKQMRQDNAQSRSVLNTRCQQINLKLAKEREYRLILEEKERLLAKNSLEWEHYHEFCKDIDRQIGEITNATNPYTGILLNLNSEFNTCCIQLETLQAEFEHSKKYIDTLAFLKFTLSREGAIGHIIEREFATLVSYTNRLLSNISGGKLSISISPQRELKSGSLKEEIDIAVLNNGHKTIYWALSDGQRQRINIALLLALNKLCVMKGINSFNFLLLDEVLDISLAEGGQQDVIFLLKQYLRECPTIILISHKEGFKASFDSCLSVYRDLDGISRFSH